MRVVAIELVHKFGTVKVTTLSKDSKQANTHVQTVDGIHRQDLGCILYSDVGDGTLNKEDFDDYDDNIQEVIKKAEDFISTFYVVKPINKDYVFKVFDDRIVLSAVNHHFVNTDSSSYQTKFYDIKSFETMEQAKAFIESILKDNQIDTPPHE